MKMVSFVFLTRYNWPGRMDHKAASGKKKRHCALFLFQCGTQKRSPLFHLKIGVSFCCFSVVAIALLRLRGWLIFICISNSGRPTVLTVGSWFLVWLLNNRPALHTGRIRFTYPALKVVLKPIFWNHQKALFGPKTTSALWPCWT